MTHALLKTNHKSGFTLLEIMLSIIIVSIVAFGGLAYSQYANRILIEKEREHIAIALATSRMDVIRSMTRNEREAAGIDDGNVYYLLSDRTSSEDLSPESVPINGYTGQIWSRIHMVDTRKPNSKTAAGKALEVEVYVKYGAGPESYIYLNSLHYN